MGTETSERLSAVAVVVCYNNGANAARTLELVPPAEERDFDVVVVDDGSTDETSASLDSFPFPVVRHTQNRGLGAALQSGLRYALDHGYQIVSIMAGNAKDDPRQISRLLAPIREGTADYVQGSRYAPGGSHENTPLFRYVMVRVHAAMLYLLTGFRGTDALNGFRAYRTSVLTGGEIDVFQNWLEGYELETYLHYKVLKSHQRVVEVGVSKSYPPKKGRPKYSHIRPFIDWWRILRPIPLLMFRFKR